MNSEFSTTLQEAAKAAPRSWPEFWAAILSYHAKLPLGRPQTSQDPQAKSKARQVGNQNKDWFLF